MHGIIPEHDLIIIRQMHSDLRRSADASRRFRSAGGRHRFRSRNRRRIRP